MNDLMIPSGLPAEKLEIGRELSRIYESAMWSSQCQFEQMKIWRLANLVFGLPAAVLAAISGGTGLANASSADPSATPAVLALIAAGFGAALTTLNPSRRGTQAQVAGTAYLEVQTASRQLLLIDLVIITLDEARNELSELTARRDEINKTADPPGRIAYWLTKKNITRGGQSYKIDKEDSR